MELNTRTKEFFNALSALCDDFNVTCIRDKAVFTIDGSEISFEYCRGTDEKGIFFGISETNYKREYHPEV